MHGTIGAADGSHDDVRRVPLRIRRGVLAVLAASTAAITLGPTPVGMLDGAHRAGRWFAVRLPGRWGMHPTRGETEALLNIAVPLVLVVAVGAAWPAIRPVRLLAGALVLSVAVEAAQIALPGRYPHVRDVVLNAVGAVVGTVAVFVARRACARASPPSRPA